MNKTTPTIIAINVPIKAANPVHIIAQACPAVESHISSVILLEATTVIIKIEIGSKRENHFEILWDAIETSALLFLDQTKPTTTRSAIRKVMPKFLFIVIQATFCVMSKTGKKDKSILCQRNLVIFIH